MIRRVGGRGDRVLVALGAIDGRLVGGVVQGQRRGDARGSAGGYEARGQLGRALG